MMQKKFILFGTGMSVFLALLLVITSCKKEVEPFELIDADYSIEKVEYTINNEELNEFSQVVIKVDVRNQGLYDPRGTYLYVSLDGEYNREIRIDPMNSGEVRTIDFVWDAVQGNHVFDLKVNITPTNEFLIEENNENNNTALLELDVILVERQVVSQEEVEVEDFEEEVDQEDEAVVEIVEFLETENLGTSDDGLFIRTEYDQEGVVNYTMSLHNPDGSVAENKVLQISTFVASDGTEVTVPMVTERGDNDDEYFLYDDDVKIRVSNGGSTLEVVEGAFLKEGCDEPGPLYMAANDPGLPLESSFGCYMYALANTTTPEEMGDALAACTLTAMLLAVYENSVIDNAPFIQYYTSGYVECSECDGTTKNIYAYDIYKAIFGDDRGIATTSADTYTPSCSNPTAPHTFSVTDCAGNSTSVVVAAEGYIIGTVENDPDCHDQGGE
jgi:hypothetical protein